MYIRLHTYVLDSFLHAYVNKIFKKYIYVYLHIHVLLCFLYFAANNHQAVTIPFNFPQNDFPLQ